MFCAYNPCFEREQCLLIQQFEYAAIGKIILMMTVRNRLYRLNRNGHIESLGVYLNGTSVGRTSLGFPMACASTSVISSRKLSGIFFLSTFVIIRSSGILTSSSAAYAHTPSDTLAGMVKGEGVM